MSEIYPIYRLDKAWSQFEQPVDGAIGKEWYRHPELGQCLFKDARSKTLRTNVDWTEKVVYELAKLLDLPAARYELATGYLRDFTELIIGVISLNYLTESIDEEIPGRQFLHSVEIAGNIQQQPYTIERIVNALDTANVLPPSDWQGVDAIDTGAKLYIGYMLLDTWIANTDRHDRNWGVMSVGDRLELIPSYDHGYSLGVHLDDRTKSTQSPERFAVETPSDFRDSDDGAGYFESSERVLCRDVFANAAKFHPEAAIIWQQQLAKVTPIQIKEIFARIPTERITPISAKFAQDLLIYNQEKILSLDLFQDRNIPAFTQASNTSPTAFTQASNRSSSSQSPKPTRKKNQGLSQ